MFITRQDFRQRMKQAERDKILADFNRQMDSLDMVMRALRSAGLVKFWDSEGIKITMVTHEVHA